MTPQGTDVEDNSVGSWLRKKTRQKKLRDKWNSLYFLPFDVINERKTLAGQAKKGPRSGNQLYKELNCKDCGQVFHSRYNHSNHSDQSTHSYHNVHITNSAKVLSEKSSTRRASRVHDTCEEITIDDDDDEVTCIDPESPVSVSAELESLSRSSLFQPEVSLSLSLTSAMRREDRKREKVNLSKEICNIKEKLVALFSAGERRSGEERRGSAVSSVKKAVSSLTKVLAGKGTKRRNEGRKPGQSPLTLSERYVQSPARKKPFRPISLLHRFNEAVTGTVSEESPTESVHEVDEDVLLDKTTTGHIDIVTLDEEVTEDILTDNSIDNDVEQEDLILVEDSDEESDDMNSSQNCPLSPQSEEVSFLEKLKLTADNKMSTPASTENVIDYIDVF